MAAVERSTVRDEGFLPPASRIISLGACGMGTGPSVFATAVALGATVPFFAILFCVKLIKSATLILSIYGLALITLGGTMFLIAASSLALNTLNASPVPSTCIPYICSLLGSLPKRFKNESLLPAIIFKPTRMFSSISLRLAGSPPKFFHVLSIIWNRPRAEDLVFFAALLSVLSALAMRRATSGSIPRSIAAARILS